VHYIPRLQALTPVALRYREGKERTLGAFIPRLARLHAPSTSSQSSLLAPSCLHAPPDGLSVGPDAIRARQRAAGIRQPAAVDAKGTRCRHRSSLGSPQDGARCW
jgi:hypothetical protein